MAEIVVDSSVVIKWFVTEPFSEEARRVLAGYQDERLVNAVSKSFPNTVWVAQWSL